MKNIFTIFLSLILIVIFSACGSSKANVTVKMKSSIASSSSINDLVVAQDTQSDPSGSDADGDGGISRFITPTSFKVAFKSLTLMNENGDEFELIPNHANLSDSLVLDLSQTVTLNSDLLSLLNGNYSYRAEIYYYEIQMPINNPSVNTTIRIYLSDDDFPSEGSLGHHQGDITMIDASGHELGWFPNAQEWIQANLKPNRSGIGGAGGTDSETGHARGMFGDAMLWNKEEFQQGADQDIYILEGQFNLDVPGNATVTFSFDVTDTWFYEDFNGNQLFDPCAGGTHDACATGAEWSPIFNVPNIDIQ